MVLENGYSDVLCLDWCESAINKIKQILNVTYCIGSTEREKLDICINYTIQDIRSMTFERRTFDVVIDKGTLDGIDCGVTMSSVIDNNREVHNDHLVHNDHYQCTGNNNDFSAHIKYLCSV